MQSGSWFNVARAWSCTLSTVAESSEQQLFFHADAGRRCSPSPFAAHATTSTPAPQPASRHAAAAADLFLFQALNCMTSGSGRDEAAVRDGPGLRVGFGDLTRVCCCGAALASSSWHTPCCADVQVVGDKHDMEEGAPVLKKTVFGVCLCALSVQASCHLAAALPRLRQLCVYLNQLCF